MKKASGNTGVKRSKRYRVGKQALFPVKQVVTDDRADIAFVYTGTLLHDSRKVMAGICLLCDLCLVWGRDMGIRDNKGRQEGMGFFTFCAKYTHNAHTDWAGRDF